MKTRAQKIQRRELQWPKHMTPATGFTAVFKTIPVGQGVWKRPEPLAAHVREAQDVWQQNQQGE